MVEHLRNTVMDATSRLIAGAFRRDGEQLESRKTPRFSIPANRHRDDDFIVQDAIEKAADTIERLEQEKAELLAACEAHAAWQWAEENHEIASFQWRMELCCYAQWLTARALQKSQGEEPMDDYRGVPRLGMYWDSDGISVDIERGTETACQEVVDTLIAQYRDAIAKAKSTK